MGGGFISSIGAIATSDGQHILTGAATSIRIYSTTTSALVAELRGHTGDVTALVLDPHSTKKVYSGSQDGTVRLWDITDGTLLKTFHVKSPVVSLVVPAVGLHAFVAVSHSGGQKHGRVLRLSTATGQLEQGLFRTNVARPLTVSPGGAYVATFDKHSLHIWVTRHAERKPLTLHHTKALTCVAFDAAEERVAAGDVSGRISIWNAYPAAVASSAATSAPPAEAQHAEQPGGGGGAPHQQQQQQPGKGGGGRDAGLTKQTLHWHSGPVRALSFGREGAYLLSGGDEAVLVIWRLDTGARTYLPRLAGAVTNISAVPADAAAYVLTQADNTIRMVNVATMRVLCSLHGLRPPVRGAPRTVAALVPGAGGSGQLALAGPGSVVQLFDAARDRHVDRVQVGHRNVAALAGTDPLAVPDAPQVESHVSHVAFSGDGAVMATVDVHPSAGVSGPIGSALKFWEARQGGATSGGAPSYALSTHVSEPHRGLVTGLAYHPHEHVAATTSSDGGLRLWERQAPRESGGGKGGAAAAGGAAQGATWRCLSSSAYQGQAMSAVAFSTDGSLVAAAVSGGVTLWDPAANALVAVLPNPGPAAGSAMGAVHFVPGTPFLVGSCLGDAPSLVVWDLLSASVCWSAACAVHCLAVDPAHGCFAVALPPEPPRRWSPSSEAGARPDQAPQLLGSSLTQRDGGGAGLSLLDSYDVGEVASPAGGAAPMQVNGGGSGGEHQLPNGVASLATTSADSPMAQPADDNAAGDQTEGAGRGGDRAGEEGGTALASLEAGAQLAGGAFWYDEEEAGGGKAGGLIYGGGGGTVLLFEAGCPTPKQAWMLPRSGVSALMFVGEGSALAEAAATRAPAGSSPLLILTDDRQYTIAPAAGAAAEHTVGAAALSGTGARTADPLGYEAAFGPLQTAAGAAEGAVGARGKLPNRSAAGDQGDGGVPDLSEIWDTPSHALPPPGVLSELSLEAMLAGLAH